MSRTRHLFMQLIGLMSVIPIGICVLATAAAGQATSANLPADCSAYASIPVPAEGEKVPIPKTPPVCASYRSYRGIERPVDYSEARACAWQERLAQKADLGQNQQEPIAWVIGGSLILADIYFNGAGVKRNIPLAMHFACESEEGMAKLALPDIAKLNGSPRAHGPFEFCDYATTTFTMTFCSGYASEIEDDRRSRYYKSLKSSMTVEQQAAFEKLFAARSAYIGAHASEVDQGGTIRAVRTIGSQSILKDLFHTELIHFEHRKWPALSDNQITMADASLDREYMKKIQQLRTQTKESIDEGAVTADHVSSVEETWEKYRDAWVAFARLRYPAAVAAIRAEITLDRYRLLKTIR
ncbi:MAG TPA: lysozyme inhibitor LprI family protein [Candidatus Dormibacteraeota bacterium]|nr:lysozyme inhibitor LprI family protein [Candidatus Dormibacteraeota bacterium]